MDKLLSGSDTVKEVARLENDEGVVAGIRRKLFHIRTHQSSQPAKVRVITSECGAKPRCCNAGGIDPRRITQLPPVSYTDLSQIPSLHPQPICGKHKY